MDWLILLKFNFCVECGEEMFVFLKKKMGKIAIVVLGGPSVCEDDRL